MSKKSLKQASDEAVDEAFGDEQETTADTTAAESAGESAPVEPAPSEPAPTPEDLRRLHYEEITKLSEQVDEAFGAAVSAKQEAAEAKKLYEGLNAKLLRLIRRGPEMQRQLPLGESGEGDAPIASDAWRDVPIRELADYGVSDSLNDLLRENRLETLGDLDDFWKRGKRLNDIKGIGEEKAAKIADAYADYGVAHPELFGKLPEQAADENDAEEGFVSGDVDESAAEQTDAA